MTVSAGKDASSGVAATLLLLLLLLLLPIGTRDLVGRKRALSRRFLHSCSTRSQARRVRVIRVYESDFDDAFTPLTATHML